MKRILAAEEIAQLALALLALARQPLSLPYWLWPLVFFSPDLGMLGYLVSPRVGAWTYNFLHHKGVAVVVILAGYFSAIPVMTFAGLVLFAHAAFDRIFGYGLKHETDFKNTHLGTLSPGRR